MDGNNPSPSLREKEIFLQALEIQRREDRAAYLDRTCGEDLRLRQSVEDLLKHIQDGDRFGNGDQDSSLLETGGEKAGDVIGDFRLLEEIGVGGWGAFNYPQVFVKNEDFLRIKCTNIDSCGG